MTSTLAPGARWAGAFLAAAAVFALAAPAAAQDPTDPFSTEVRESMERQDELVSKRRYDAVIQEAEKGTKDGSPDSYYLLGRAYGNVAVARLGSDHQEAATLLDKAVRAFDRAKEQGGLLYAPAHVGTARCARFRAELHAVSRNRALAAGDTSAAEKALQALQQELELAARELETALRINSQFRMATLELAQVRWQQGRYAEAERLLYDLIDERPTDAKARMLMAAIKMERKRWGDAVLELRHVLELEPENGNARRLLASALMFQQKYRESAKHWERLRLENPKDDEPYMMLFHIYRQLKDETRARKVLHDLVRELPGTEASRRAKTTLKEMDENPDFFEPEVDRSRQSLVDSLQSDDPARVVASLRKMQEMEWPALPADVYRLISPEAGTPEVRLHAVRLISQMQDQRTLPLLEIVLFHPKERDQDQRVRREAARAVGKLPTPATVLVLYEALDDPDEWVREWAVQGIAARTGKYFREDLEERTTDPEAWAAERAAYSRWWNSASGSFAKRSAARALGPLFKHMAKGLRRIGRYALLAMQESDPKTWDVGYALFQELTFHTFEAQVTEEDWEFRDGETEAQRDARVEALARSSITQQAVHWFRENGHLEY